MCFCIRQLKMMCKLSEAGGGGEGGLNEPDSWKGIFILAINLERNI